MISKRRLQFKLGETREKITPLSGLALFGEYVLQVGLKEAVEKAFPKPPKSPKNSTKTPFSKSTSDFGTSTSS